MSEASKERAAAILFGSLLFVMMVISAADGDVYSAYTSVLGIFLTFLPMLVRRTGTVRLPWPVTAGTGAVTLMHVLGIHNNYYDLVWWWDAMTHSMSTVLLAMVMAAALVSLEVQGPDVRLPRRATPFLVIAGTILLGVIWEVCEFVFDGALGMNMQYSLDDTAMDLSFDILGGVLVAILIPPFLPWLEATSRDRFAVFAKYLR